MPLQKLGRRLTVHFALIQICFNMAYCCVLNFSAVYLLGWGLTNSQVGIVLTIGNAMTLFLQPMMSTWVDKGGRVTARRLVLALLAAIIVLFALLTGLPAGVPGWLPTALYVLLACLVMAEFPMLITLSMEPVYKGIPLNYSVARALGSLMYSFTSYVMGYWVEDAGAWVLMPVALGLSVIQIVAVVFFRFKVPEGAGASATAAPQGAVRLAAEEDAANLAAAGAPDGVGAPAAAGLAEAAVLSETDEAAGSTGAAAMAGDAGGAAEPRAKGGFISFLRQHKRFTVIIVGTALIYYSHALINSYLIQIVRNVGGDAGSMGTAGALAALLEVPAMMLFPLLLKRVGKAERVLQFALAAFLVKALCTLFAPSLGWLYFAQALQFFAFAMYTPSSVYYVKEVIDEADAAKGQSSMNMAPMVSGLVASLTGGFMLDAWGVQAMLAVSCVAGAAGLVVTYAAMSKRGQKAAAQGAGPAGPGGKT